MLMLGACAHRLPGRDIRLEALRAVSETMPSVQICLPVGFTDPDSPIEDGFAMFAEAQPNDGFAFDRVRQARFDALVAAGLLTLEATAMRRGSIETPIRIYRATPLGEQHRRPAEIGSDDGLGFEPRFCYGRGDIVRVWDIDWTDFGGCAEALYASVLYTYGTFPEWAQNPSLQAAFPAWVGRAGADVVRYRRLTFLRRGDRWVPGRFNAAHSNCVSERRTRNRRFGG